MNYIPQEEAQILSEIKEVLADYQEAIEAPTFEIVTIEINYRRLIKASQLDEDAEILSKDTVYRITHEANLLEEKQLLDETTSTLEENPDYDEEATAQLNSMRPTVEQFFESVIYEFMNGARFLEQQEEKQPLDEMKYQAISEIIIEWLDQNPEASYLRVISEFNLHKNPVSIKRVEDLMIRIGFWVKRSWLLQRIRDLKAQDRYKNYGARRLNGSHQQNFT